MSNAGEITGITRAALGSWVEREERNTGSRMGAYEGVAATIGRSPSWIREFLRPNSDRAKQPDWSVGWSILSAYGRICERIEREAQAEIDRAKTLQRQIDAALESTLEMVARETRADAPQQAPRQDHPRGASEGEGGA